VSSHNKLVFMHGAYHAQTNSLTVTPYSYAEKGDCGWGEDFRLNRKLSKEHHTFALPRLDAGRETASRRGKTAPESALGNMLFDKSSKYYKRQTDPGGRFAYVKYDDALFTALSPFETTAAPVRDDEQRQPEEPPKNVVACVLETQSHVLFVGEGGMGKTAVALRHIAPYAAHALESEGQFSMPQERLITLVEDFLTERGEDAFNREKKALSRLLLAFRVPREAYSGDALEYVNLLTNIHHVFGDTVVTNFDGAVLLSNSLLPVGHRSGVTSAV